ncbi:hypothetical protein BC830DRAFT_1117221 [Chytriomyces sp. MP71]|nr:hypothetical protein BC830DRAFT_1117221 [Chytriomyces sp. MP71]
MGWTIDLYKNSLPYKLLQTLTPTPLSPDTTWTLVNIPASLVLSNDYSVRLRAVLDPNAYPNQDVGSVTPFFKVLASPADQKTWNTTCIALFPGNAKPTVKSAGVATNAVTRGNQTRGAGAQPGNPNPFGNPNGAVLRPSAISSLILMAMFGVLA